MRDGSTRQIELEPAPDRRFENFGRDWQVSLVLVSGSEAGSEWLLEAPAHVLGRGESSDLRFPDPALSSEHAAFEFVGDGYRLRDLASMNGVCVNGVEVKTALLKNGDEIRLGTLVLRFVVEARQRGPRTYQVPLD